jgi:hypothetical protein
MTATRQTRTSVSTAILTDTARLDRLLHFFERDRPLPRSLQRARQAFYVAADCATDQLDPSVL